jgi:radical SAM protein with 4Fe4S-binding SPASM domain
MSNILNQIISAGLRPPKMLTLSITDGCNLQCLHCLLDCRDHKKTPPVPKNTLLGVIHAFAGMGGERILITGGEPLTHPDWFEILAFACGQHGLKEVCLQTNATLLTRDKVSALVSLRFKGLSIQVSLDGAAAETHDHVRGKGSFEQILQGLRLLSDAGLGSQIRLAFTEMRHNIEDLPRVFEIMGKLGVGKIVSGTLVQGGRAAQSNQVDLPMPSQYRELLSRYHTDLKFRTQYKKVGNIAAFSWYKGRLSPSGQVCTCIENPFITAGGLMYPCVMFLSDRFAARDVHRLPLDEVVMKTLPLWAELPKISLRRSAELKECKGCPGRLHCGGGCMGRAYAAHGNLMTVEDRCSLRKAVYTWDAPKFP